MPTPDYTKWHLPKGAKARLGKGYINEIAYSPDSNCLAVASSIGIWIYDADTGEELALFTGHTDNIESLTYSPEGKIIATEGRNVCLWDAATGEHKATLLGHADRVDSVVYSPDGKTIAAKVGCSTSIARSFEHSVYLWDVTTGKYISTLTQNLHGIYSFAYSPDGKTIATGTYKEVHLWDAATGEHKTTLTGHTGSIENIVYSPDGKIIATSGGRFHKEVHLWDAATGVHKTMLTDGSGGVSVAYSPDGETIAIADWSTVNLWDTEASVLKATLTKYNHSIEGISYSPDGKTIATWTYEEVHLWDATTGKHKTTLTGHAKGVKNIMYGPDGKTVATDCYDLNLSEKVHLWDVATGKHKTAQDKIVYSPDGKTIAIWSWGKEKNQEVHLWDTATIEHKTALIEHADNLERFAYSPDGKTIAIWSQDLEDDLFLGGFPKEHKGHLWNTATGEHKATLSEHTNNIEYFTYSPDGKTIAIWSWEEKKNSEVRLWNTTTGKQIATLMGPAGTHSVESVMYSPDGKNIAIRGDKEVYLWNTATGEREATLTGHTNSTEYFAYSPDSNTIATRGYEEAHWNFAVTGMRRITVEERVCLWDAATGNLMWNVTTGKYHGKLLGGEGFMYSPDGKTIAIQRYNKEISLWDTVTGKHKVTLSGYTDSIDTGFETLVYSPDGQTIAIKNDTKYARDNSGRITTYLTTVCLWDTVSGEHKATLTGHTGGIKSFAYSPDGKTIATKGDKEVYLWDAATGKQKATFIGHVGDIYSFSYSPDGKTIATGSDDGTVFLWETTSFISQYPDFNPQEIHGNWRAGWALDVHTLASRPLPGGGYETARTELGESVYQLKYRHDTNKIQPIVEIAVEFLKGEFRVDGHPVVPHIEAILPIPLSSHETFQPVPEIATQMGQILGVPVPLDYLIKAKNTGRHNFESEESRREQLQGAFAVQTKNRQYRCVLLLDDIYNSGVTLTEAIEVLQKQGGIHDVLVLTLTYTRTKR